MIKSAKARTSVIALILFIFSTSHLFAQNKVVVVPFGGVDGVPAEEINLHHMWSGSVFGDGAIRQAGLYTFTRSSTGTYNVSLDVTGFDIPSTVNSQSNFPIPTAIIEFGDPGDSIRIGGRSVGSTSGIVTSASFSVYTYTSANVLADKNFLFHARFAESSTASPSGLANSELQDSAECITVEETVTCTTGEN